MGQNQPLSAKLERELSRASRAVDRGLWRHDSLVAALSSGDGTQINFNFNCAPRVPDTEARAVPETVSNTATAQDVCVRNVQDMIDVLRANLPPQHEVWSAALADLQADEDTLTMLFFGKEGLGTPWHADRADAFNIAFALSKKVRTTMSSAGLLSHDVADAP